ncbi:hypothetical protein [Streptomyces phaeofaciens]|uniref:hypothetical protein n=1 Tax=Streptomyces phaeofaciens TaxID=68254 RepID=UPI0036B23346
MAARQLLGHGADVALAGRNQGRVEQRSEAGGAAVVVTGEIVDRPALGTADRAAAKTAPAPWPGITGREAGHRYVTVTDARLPQPNTGSAPHAVVGRAPAVGPGADPEEAVAGLAVAPAPDARTEQRQHQNSIRVSLQARALHSHRRPFPGWCHA